LRLIFVCLELSFVWLVYFLFGLVTAYEVPIWRTALMVIVVDRCVGFISSIAQERRKRLDD